MTHDSSPFLIPFCEKEYTHCSLSLYKWRKGGFIQPSKLKRLQRRKKKKKMISRSNFSPLPAASSRLYSTSDSFIRPAGVSFQTTQSRLPTIRAAINDGSYAGPASISLLDNMSFYELLGISEDGSFGEIKQAYKQLARKYHPDVSPPDRVEEYTQRFIRVQEAYETLSDPERRALYDRDMSRGIHLAFSARKIYQSREAKVEKSEWKSLWMSQLSELKRNSAYKDESKNMSWGSRMRRQRNRHSDVATES